MSAETLERSPSPYKYYEVVTSPDTNRYEQAERLPDYAITNRFTPPEESQKREISPFLPRNSPLERAGFLLYRQMVNFLNTVNEGKLEEAVAELLIEVRAHANEYTREAPLLVGNVKKAKQGIVNNYNNKPVINQLDWRERDGATARGNMDLNERVLIAQPGDSIVQVSPSGWNGLYPDYEKSQIVFVRSKNGREDLEQLAFVLHFKPENCITLLEKMGVSRADLVCFDPRETIKKIVCQAVSLKNETTASRPEDFLSLLKEVNPNDPALRIIQRDLQRYLNGENISVLPPVCEAYLQSLETLIRDNAGRLNNFAFQAEVSNRVEETIYKIAEFIRGKPVAYRFSTDSFTARSDDWRDSYRGIIQVLQEISGCAGGGSRSMRAMGGILSVGLSFAGIEGSGDYHLGSCAVCKRANVLVGGCDICTSCEENMAGY